MILLENTFRSVQAASRKLSLVSDQKINEALLLLADATLNDIPGILEANKKDLGRMPESDPRYDRLKLTARRMHDIAADIRNVAGLPSPLGIILEEKKVKSGLDLRKITVPLGVVGVIYEARPNVTFDVFSLCLKSGNACILKGGSDAANSNQHIYQLIQRVLSLAGLDENIVGPASDCCVAAGGGVCGYPHSARQSKSHRFRAGQCQSPGYRNGCRHCTYILRQDR
jgi:glutamate-5-semialdehyde dehydrogenase